MHRQAGRQSVVIVNLHYRPGGSPDQVLSPKRSSTPQWVAARRTKAFARATLNRDRGRPKRSPVLYGHRSGSLGQRRYLGSAFRQEPQRFQADEG